MHPGTAVATPRAPFARLAARFGRADTHRSLAADALPNSAERSSVLRCCRAARNRIPNKRLPASVTLSHCRNFPAALLYCVLHAAHAPLPHAQFCLYMLWRTYCVSQGPNIRVRRLPHERARPEFSLPVVCRDMLRFLPENSSALAAPPRWAHGWRWRSGCLRRPGPLLTLSAAQIDRTT